jgi:hypothetical protein
MAASADDSVDAPDLPANAVKDLQDVAALDFFQGAFMRFFGLRRHQLFPPTS